MRYCQKCKRPAHNTTFATERALYCIDCKQESRRERKEKNRAYSRMRSYGLTVEQVKQMTLEQGSKCAICGKNDEIFNVDHCHSTGKVRGLLCRECNYGLGFFRDSIESLRQAIKYLIKAGK